MFVSWQHVNEAMLREDRENEVEFHFEPILRDASFMAVQPQVAQAHYLCHV